MLIAGSEAMADHDAWYEAWRRRELGRIDRAGVTYLDYTGAALYAESLVRADAERLASSVLGNPHSQSAPSLDATRDVERARSAILAFLNADPDEYTVVLTPNASGACRLVGEAFPFAPGGVLALMQDNHNSVNGLRSWAARRGAAHVTVPLAADLRLADPWPLLGDAPAAPSLLAFPAQSNFSGVRHPLALVGEARRRGWRVILDAASYLASHDLDLRTVQPDFLCLSLYKIAGYPTGIGALVARREALGLLDRPSFAGGTVQWVSVAHNRHRLVPGAEGFEDGTVPFLAAGAIPAALEAVRGSDRPRLAQHLHALTSDLLSRLVRLRHSAGGAMVLLHGPGNAEERGPTLALSLLDRRGAVIPYWEVEEAARDAGIAVRGGCFCNPGCAEQSFSFCDIPLLPCLEELGDTFTIPALSACLGGRPVGAVRVSLGCGSVRRDVERFVRFVEEVSAARGGHALPPVEAA